MQERFYFGDEVLPLFETGIPLLRQRLSQLPDADNVSILCYFIHILSVDQRVMLKEGIFYIVFSFTFFSMNF